MELPLELKEKLENIGIKSLNEMQEAAFDTIQNYANTLLKSPTGSGKTLAFLLPILQLIDKEKKGIQCIIISPTRELCLQIEAVWKQLSTGFKVNTFYGGHSMPQEIANLSDLPTLLIGTPGRLADHISRNTFPCKSITMVVFDEFDKAMTLGFHDQIEFILSALPNIEKKIMVSATAAVQIPKFVDFQDFKTLNFTIKEAEKEGLFFQKIVSTENEKLENLTALLSQIEDNQAIIFCNQRDEVDELAMQLKKRKVKASLFHGGLDQDDRERALIKFRNKSTHYLITTDLGARGLDIPDVTYVIHYQLPTKGHEFTHRNGRTARMNAAGVVILFLDPNESQPEYIPTEIPDYVYSDHLSEIQEPMFATIYISGGKKEKINKVDIVGFFCQKGNIEKSDIGIIQVNDHQSFVAVKTDKIKSLLDLVQNEKLKGKKLKIELAY